MKPENREQRTEEVKKQLAEMVLPVLEESPQLIQAVLDFHRQKASGMVEIHFSDGGIAKIFANIKRAYK